VRQHGTIFLGGAKGGKRGPGGMDGLSLNKRKRENVHQGSLHREREVEVESMGKVG